MRQPNHARRSQIAALLGKKTQTEIATELGIDQSTVSYYAARLRGENPKTRSAPTNDLSSLRKEILDLARPIIMAELRERLSL